MNDAQYALYECQERTVRLCHRMQSEVLYIHECAVRLYYRMNAR